MNGADAGRSRPKRALLARQDFVGGLVVIAIAAFAYWQAADLAVGKLGGMGPGMLPKALALALAVLGAMLVADAVIRADG